MNLRETELEGAFVVELERHEDERGFFARTWCREEAAAHGLDAEVAQCSISYNRRRGTLRGLHYQADPYPESKLVRCTRGAVYDVIVDLRRGSPTYLKWTAVALSEQNRKMLFVPEGLAHGFQALVDETEVAYQVSEAYRPELARGIRWNDPTLAITWPLPERAIVSERDRALPYVTELMAPRRAAG